MRHAIVTFALCAAIVLGVGIGAMELYHLRHADHAFDHWPFVWAGALILFPALALQKGDIAASITIVAENAPLGGLFKRQGRRETDPLIPVQPPPAAVVVAPADPPPPMDQGEK